MKKEKERFLLVDAIRGLAVVNMVIFHFLYDIFMIYGKNPKWYFKPSIHLWQQAICWTFIFISGFVWKWGERTNIRRGLLFNLYGVLITVITRNLIPSETIWFGILSFMGCAILLLVLLQKVLRRVSPVWGMMVSFLLFIFLRHAQLELPQSIDFIKILTPLGFPFSGFVSSDYFPIFPWIFLYLCGYFCNQIFLKHDLWKKVACWKVPILSWIGQKSIWIYLLHQPVSMLICMAIF